MAHSPFVPRNHGGKYSGEARVPKRKNVKSDSTAKSTQHNRQYPVDKHKSSDGSDASVMFSFGFNNITDMIHSNISKKQNNSSQVSNTGVTSLSQESKHGSSRKPKSLSARSGKDGNIKSKPKKYKTKPNNKNENINNAINNAIPTSEWILVSNIPPSSHLSDIFPSLSKIVDFELKKGIIDLDAIREDEESDIPIWKPPEEIPTFTTFSESFQNVNDSPDDGTNVSSSNSSNSNHSSLPSHMILEARIHLSYRARPLGWFLRFPNRSVVNAILNHVNEAERLQHEIKQYGRPEKMGENDDKRLKRERWEWREGLWEGVMHDVNSNVTMSKETDEFDVQREVEDESESPGEDSESFSNENENEHALSSCPSVPDHLMPLTPSEEQQSLANYHSLRCGLETLSIQEFHPNSFDNTTAEKQEARQHLPWEQHSFHMGPLLQLSDSVVRVETTALKTTIEEIQYLFRGYHLKSIWPDESSDVDDSNISSTSTVVPSIYTKYPKSIGWTLPPAAQNNKHRPPQSAVDFLLRGSNKNRSKIDEVDNVGLPKKHTFLVRFANPAEARMAVRDKRGIPFSATRLLVSQFPRQELSSC